MSKNRLIINIQDDTSIKDALLCIYEVIKLGRVSGNGKSYCYCSKFNDGTVVIADKKKADIFYVRKEGGRDES